MNEKDEDGGEVQALTGTLWHVPYLDATIDARQWLSKSIPAPEVQASWFNLLDEARDNDGFRVFIWHPHVMGISDEYRAVGENILHKVTREQGFRIVTLQELVAEAAAELRA